MRAAVASPHAAATRVGADVLAAGGNAMDAAVAVNAMLTVASPSTSAARTSIIACRGP